MVHWLLPYGGLDLCRLRAARSSSSIPIKTMMTQRRSLVATAVLFAALGGIFDTSQAAGVIYHRTFLGTDFVSAGYGGMRGGDGTGLITLSGVTGTVTSALLYWHGPQDEAGSNASVLFAGNAVTGVSLGRASDNLWGFAHSEAYRADVTALVLGDGDYDLANFIKPGLAEINGVSLLVAFDDGDASNNRDILLFEGNDSNVGDGADPDGWEAPLGSFTYSGGDVVLELGVADGQDVFDDAAIEVNGVELVPTGAIFDGASVPNGPTAADTAGGLWDIRKFEIDSQLAPGFNEIELSSFVEQDALSLVHVVVNLPAGTSPVPPPDRVPEGGRGWALLVASLTALRLFAGRPGKRG